MATLSPKPDPNDPITQFNQALAQVHASYGSLEDYETFWAANINNVAPLLANDAVVSVVTTTSSTGVPIVGQVSYTTDTNQAAVYDGSGWLPLALSDVSACGKFRGRKARRCTDCHHTYLEHDEGAAADFRQRLLSMRDRVKEL